MKKLIIMITVMLLILSACNRLNVNNHGDTIENKDINEIKEEINSLKIQISELNNKIQELNRNNSEKTGDNLTNTDEMVLCSEEALLLFSKARGFSIDEMDCSISTYKDGFLELSWANPGRGTGGGWYMNPYNGDVYSWDDQLLFNVYDELKE